jgi:hypothetical protein
MVMREGEKELMYLNQAFLSFRISGSLCVFPLIFNSAYAHHHLPTSSEISQNMHVVPSYLSFRSGRINSTCVFDADIAGNPPNEDCQKLFYHVFLLRCHLVFCGVIVVDQADHEWNPGGFPFA